MRRLLMITLLCMAAIGLLCASASSAGQSPRIGIRGGVGTDVNLGLAYGAGVNFLLDAGGNAVELGVVLFGGSFDETSNNGYNTYDETTDIFVFGLMANYLINYAPRESGLFFVVGMGLGAISVAWEETSATDTSLGTPLPGGGSMQSVEGSTAGTIFNLGIGGSFKNGIDIRAELPVILAFDAPGDASSVIPTATATIGYRF
jgi:hypothetical protein